MKNTLLLLICAVFSLTVSAQENKVTRMPEKPDRAAYTDYSQSQSGYWFTVEGLGGSMADPNSKCLQFIGAQTVNGLRLNEFLRGGIGIGMKYYFKSEDVRTSTISWGFPLYANLRGNIISQNDRAAVPFWSLEAGTEIRSGFFVSPLIGLKLGEQRSSFTVGLSYTIIKMDTWDKDGDMRNLVTLKFGYEF